jgi:hypothetical protein
MHRAVPEIRGSRAGCRAGNREGLPGPRARPGCRQSMPEGGAGCGRAPHGRAGRASRGGYRHRRAPGACRADGRAVAAAADAAPTHPSRGPLMSAVSLRAGPARNPAVADSIGASVRLISGLVQPVAIPVGKRSLFKGNPQCSWPWGGGRRLRPSHATARAISGAAGGTRWCPMPRLASVAQLRSGTDRDGPGRCRCAGCPTAVLLQTSQRQSTGSPGSPGGDVTRRPSSTRCRDHAGCEWGNTQIGGGPHA